VKLSRTDAIRIARETVQQLGHSLESVFAELDPEVQGPTRSVADRDKWVPNYQVAWRNPNGGITTAEIEVNGNTGEVPRVYFLSRNLHRPSPKVEVPEKPLAKGHPLSEAPEPINPEYLERLKPLAMEAANAFMKKTGLGDGELTTNHVENFHHVLEPTGVDTLILLTNGASFVFKFDRITRYSRSDVFFTANRPYLIADFKGEWKLDDKQAEELARSVVKRLEEPDISLGVEQPPQHQYKPKTPGFDPPLIPRISFYWSQKDDRRRFVSNADVEVNAETGEITFIGWSHRNMLGDKPKINVPIQPPAEDQLLQNSTGNAQK
jgi:hypothetical protein